jgi:hypothetical protein
LFIIAGEMIYMRKLLFILILLPAVSFCQNEDSIFIRKIANEVLVKGTAYENLRYLSKKIGGRLAGSPQMVQAEKWGFSTLSQLSPDSVFLQQCMVPHWVRGGKDKALVTAINGTKQSRSLAVLALGNSLGSGKKGITANVLAVANYDELEKRKDEVKGKLFFTIILSTRLI